jgi:hypothetical protein
MGAAYSVWNSASALCVQLLQKLLVLAAAFSLSGNFVFETVSVVLSGWRFEVTMQFGSAAIFSLFSSSPVSE